MQKFGIDISRWQGDFNLAQAVTEGVQFVIIKCGGSDKGIYTDVQFENNYRKAKELGIPCGAYWYSKAMTVDEAKRDAEYCYGLLRGKQFELPIFIDVEDKQQCSIGKDKLTSIIDAFLSYLEQRKYYVGIYSSESYFNNVMDENYLKHYCHWCARWSTKRPAINHGIWQFGGETNKIRSNKICGITVDQDYLYVDYESAIKRLGLNGYGYDPTVHDKLVELHNLGYNYSVIADELLKIMEEQ